MFAYLSEVFKTSKFQSFKAVITGFLNHGFFVDIQELGMSGLLHLSSLEDDFYHFDTRKNQVIGRRKGRIFRLGDPVSVQIQKVDTLKKQVDFKLADDSKVRKSQPKRAHRKRRGNRPKAKNSASTTPSRQSK